MTKQDFIQGKPFVVNAYDYDFQYTEITHGGEVVISNGTKSQTVEVEEISNSYFVIHCWLNKESNGKIYFKNCELKYAKSRKKHCLHHNYKIIGESMCCPDCELEQNVWT